MVMWESSEQCRRTSLLQHILPDGAFQAAEAHVRRDTNIRNNYISRECCLQLPF